MKIAIRAGRLSFRAPVLPEAAAPGPTTHTIRLRDGRTLEFAEFGVSWGTPTFFFHGFVGSHHQASLAHRTAVAQGVRLIAPNRPGVGRSSAVLRRHIREAAADVAELADALHIGDFITIGVSGGGPYALACAHQLRGRVPAVIVPSGLGPLSDPEVLRRMNPLARRILQLGRRFPGLARWAVAAELNTFHRDPEALVKRFVRRWSREDRELFARPEVAAAFRGDLVENLTRGEGPPGLAHELGLYFRWGFRLHDLPARTRVVLSHGREDNLVPPFMTAYMASRLPNAEVHYHAGGHFAILTCMDRVMGRAQEWFRARLSGR